MINTYNESDLHRTVKNLMADNYNGKTEQKVGSYICDILCADNTIIEIQTQNLGNLTAKILNLLQSHRVILVHPLATQSYIEYYAQDTDGNIAAQPLSRRKSPKKKNIYHIFDELMGIYPALLHEDFTLQIIEVVITKKRIRLEKAVQTPNKSRRFLRNWISYDTSLDKITATHLFNTAEHYTDLLPISIDKIFSIQDIRNADSANGKRIGNQANKILWTFNKMGLIEYVGKEKNRKLYKGISKS